MFRAVVLIALMLLGGSVPSGAQEASQAARSASATRVTVLSAGAVEAGVLRLARQYRRDAEREVVAHFGTAPEIEKRLSSGEAVDVLIAPAAVVDRALKAGAIVAGTETPVGQVGVGVTVRRGVPTPDVSTAAALKAALLRGALCSDDGRALAFASGQHPRSRVDAMRQADAFDQPLGAIKCFGWI